MEKEETLYNVALARQFCEELDRMTTRITEVLQTIDTDKEAYQKQLNLFNGKHFWKMYLVILLINIVPFSLITVFVNFHVEIFSPVAGMLVTLILKKRYEKKKLPTIKKVYNQTSENKEKELDNLLANLYSLCQNHDFILYDVPKELRYPIALDFIYESIKQDHVTSLDEGIAFYNHHIKKIRNNSSEDANKIIKEIDQAISVKTQREKIINKYVNVNEESEDCTRT